MLEVRSQKSESAIRIPQSEIQKTCPLCPPAIATQSIDNFGICRARSDGRNLYCKNCIRKKVSDSRRSLKEYRAQRKRLVNQPQLLFQDSGAQPETPALSSLSPVERVRKAIAKGAQTQNEIRKETRLGCDDIGAALARLLLWTREIRIETIADERRYLSNHAETVNRKPDVMSPHPAARPVATARWRVA